MAEEFFKTIFGKGSCPSSGSSIIVCNIMNTSEIAAVFFHTGVFTKLYLTVELLSSSLCTTNLCQGSYVYL